MKIIRDAANAPDPPAPRPRKTGRPCTICKLDALAEIDAALLRGEGFADLSRRYEVNPDALQRHFTKHLPIAARQEAAEAAVEAEGVRGSSLVEDVHWLRDKLKSLLRQAEAAGDLRGAIDAVKAAGKLIETEGKLLGEIDTAPQLNITFAPTLIALQATIMTALAPYGEAKEAVIRALTNGPLLLEG